MASASSPCSVSTAPSLSLRIFGLPSPMITRDSSRSIADSTAVTRAGESSPPHGL